MIFKCGPIELIYSFGIILAELTFIEIEINIQSIRITANGFANLCFRIVFNILLVIFEFFCIISPLLKI